MVTIRNFALLATDHPVTRSYIRVMVELDRRPEMVLLIDLPNVERTERVTGLRSLWNFWRSHRLRSQERRLMQIVDAWASKIGLPSPGPDRPIADVLSEAKMPFERVKASDINDAPIRAWIKKRRPSVALYVSGGIVSPELLSSGTRFLHIHPGYLPLIRGSDCLLWSALVHRRVSASAFYMVPQIDAGAVVERRWFDMPRIALPRNLLSDALSDARYRALTLRYDPGLRGAVLKSIIQRTDDTTRWKGDMLERETSCLYFTPHRAVRDKAVRLFFPTGDEERLIRCATRLRSRRRRLLVFHLRIPLHLNFMSDTINRLAKKPSLKTVIFLDNPILSARRIPSGVQVASCSHAISRMTADGLVTSDSYNPLYRMHRKIYFMHSLISTHAGYSRDSFDHFEYILCAGPHHTEELAAVLSTRGHGRQVLVPWGYEPIDRLIAAAASDKWQDSGVLFAPSWGPDNLLVRHGEDIIAALIEHHQVTLRPHVRNFLDDADVIDKITHRFGAHPNFSLDRAADPLPSISRSGILLTDWSGSAFEFALARLRPIIFVDGPRKINNPMWREDCPREPVEISYRDRIGVILKDIRDIKTCVELLLEQSAEWRDPILAARQELLYNLGKAAKIGSDTLAIIAEGEVPPGSVVVNSQHRSQY